MRVLVIAPLHVDLPNQPAEVGALANDLDATLIQGVVTERDIMAAVRERKTFEGVWLSSHAGKEGVLLSETYLDIPALAQYLSAVGARWVVFNSCEGYEFVDQLQRYYPLDVVAASVRGLADLSAWRTAALIARNLGKTHNLREALRIASPGGAAPFRFWPNPVGDTETEEARRERIAMQLEQALRLEIRSVREELHSEIERARNEATGDNHQIEITLTRLEGRMVTIENMYAVVQREPAISQKLLRWILIALGAIIGLMMAGLYIAAQGGL